MAEIYKGIRAEKSQRSPQERPWWWLRAPYGDMRDCA